MNNEIERSQQQTSIQLAEEKFNFLNPAHFDVAQRICKMFASSELVPDMYKTSEKNSLEKAMANCMIALEVSQRIGASPLMVMQNMVVIYGRPSWSAKFLIATVNTCGRFNPLQFRFTEKGMLGMVDYTEYTKTWVQGQNGRGYYKNEAKTMQFDGKKIPDIECVAFTTAKGSDAVLESSPISVRLAIQEGWYTKNGSKWQTMTRQMLMYRAASFWTNVYAPELSMGMEIAEDMTPPFVEYEDVVENMEKQKRQQANQKEVAIAPEEETSDAAPNVDMNTGEVLSSEQESEQQEEEPQGEQQEQSLESENFLEPETINKKPSRGKEPEF